MTTGLYAGQENMVITPEKSTSWLNSSGIIGEFGIAAGVNKATIETDEANPWFTQLDGSVTLPVLENKLLIFDAFARYDDFESSGNISNGEDPAWEFSIGSHFLQQFTEDTRAGFFLGYGDHLMQDKGINNSYNVLMGGIEVQSFVREDLMLYTQLGYATKGRNGEDDDEGLDNTLIGRVGGSYFPTETSSISLDFQAAHNDSYIDGNDSGRLYAALLSYERLLNTETPIYLTCFGQYNFFDTTTEGDTAREWQVGLGLRFYFGANSPKDAARKGMSIGIPSLPTRASAFTESLD